MHLASLKLDDMVEPFLTVIKGSKSFGNSSFRLVYKFCFPGFKALNRIKLGCLFSNVVLVPAVIAFIHLMLR